MKKILFFLIFFLGPIVVALKLDYPVGEKATRESAGIAPNPLWKREALIQVYSARADGWKGIFTTHTWLAVKPRGSFRYIVYEVDDFRVKIHQGMPDRYWYGRRPRVIKEISGDLAEELIPKIEKVAAQYPYLDAYTAWPGPNCNTFIAHIARELPELRLVLPPTALGKDYLTNGKLVAKTPSGTGLQFSYKGFVGLLVGIDEGFEWQMGGLVVGFNFKDPGIAIPGIGKISFTKFLQEEFEAKVEDPSISN